MNAWDRDSMLRRLEERYIAARTALISTRTEFELLARSPTHAPERLAVLAGEVERLTGERARIGEQLVRLETAIV